MKAALFFCVFMVVVLAVVPASAQLIVYDDFQEKVLDPNKWFGRGVSDPGVATLEHGRLIKNDPLFGLRWLEIFNRSYASVASDTGRSTAFNRLLFADGSNIETIQATVLVRKVQATGCSTNALATQPQARFGGMYFNTGTAIAGDSTNDVRAFIMLTRPSDSTNPSNVLDILGVVALCTDAACDTSTQIGTTVEVGKAIVNLPVKVRITWDQANNRFVFQKGRATEVDVDYDTLIVEGPPGTANGGNKRVEIYHQIPNCTDPVRPMSFMDVYFDNININP